MLKASNGYEWVALFNSHPCMIKTKEFWDLNYYRGANPPPDAWRMPGFRPDFDPDVVRNNWAFHCRRLRETPSLKLGAIAQFAAEFAQQAENASAEELAYLARRAKQSEAPFFTDRFSAAEILDLLARWYLARVGGMDVHRLARRNVGGPALMPLAVPTARRLDASALWRMARGLVVAVHTTGMLLSRIRCGEGPLGTVGEIGPSSALVALGAALSSADLHGTVPTATVAPYVKEAEEIAARVSLFTVWPCHRPDLDPSAICRLTRLQSWTLKPAWPGNVPAFA